MPSTHHHQHDTALVDLIDLDAIVLNRYVTAVTGWVRTLATGARRVIDIGAGTGAGSVALAGQFPDADIVAVDLSEEMLDRVRQRAAAGESRISTVRMDVSAPWSSSLGRFDLAWASSSLHEVDNPDAVLREIFAAINPGGLLVVVEMDAAPRFLPDGDGLEARVHEVLRHARAGHPDHPDWTTNLTNAGFDIVERRQFAIDEPAEGNGPAGEYAHAYFARIASFVRPELGRTDRDALDALLSDTGASSLRHRDDLHIRGTRTAWAASRPSAEVDHP